VLTPPPVAYALAWARALALGKSVHLLGKGVHRPGKKQISRFGPPPTPVTKIKLKIKNSAEPRLPGRPTAGCIGVFYENYNLPSLSPISVLILPTDALSPSSDKIRCERSTIFAKLPFMDSALG